MGGSFEYSFELTQTGTGWCEVDVFVDVTFPDGEVLPILQRYGVTLQAGQTIQREDMLQNVPASAPEGTYTYAAHIWNVSGWIMYAEASFTFEKLPGFGATDQGRAWTVLGWDDAFPAVENSAQRNHALLSAYPNPFNATTTIRFDLPYTGKMNLGFLTFPAVSSSSWPTVGWRPVPTR